MIEARAARTTKVSLGGSLLRRRSPRAAVDRVTLPTRIILPIVTVEHLHDIGKLLFGFTVFWSYIAFSQYFLIWYANIPEETIYHMKRQVGSWQSAGMLLASGHFLVPFFF